MPKPATLSSLFPATRTPAASCVTVRRLLLTILVQDRDIFLCEALRILRLPDKAEDVLQDAAVRCLSSQALTRVPDNPRAFLRKMVRNLALDQYRKESLEVPSDQALETLICPSVPVEQRLAAQEQLATLSKAINGLGPKRRHALIEARVRARRQTEIAREMNLSASRVHALIQSAQDQLAEAMEAGS